MLSGRARVPGNCSSGHLPKQATVVRNELQQPQVHQLQAVGTGLDGVFHDHLSRDGTSQPPPGRRLSVSPPDGTFT